MIMMKLLCSALSHATALVDRKHHMQLQQEYLSMLPRVASDDERGNKKWVVSDALHARFIESRWVGWTRDK